MELTRCGIVENNTLVNIIVAESVERAFEIFGGEIIDVTNGTPAIGWVRVDGVWIDPNAPITEESTE
jgi:hypothetical protein